MSPRSFTVAFAALLIAGCAGQGAPATAPTTPARSTEPTVAPASVAPAADPTVAPATAPASASPGSSVADGVAREALGRGSRVCVSNETEQVLSVWSVNSRGYDMQGALVPGRKGCQWGNFQRDPFQIIDSVFGSQYYEVRGTVGVHPSGPFLAEFWAFNPWVGSPWLRVDSRGGEFTDHTWSVGDRWTITAHGYTLSTERIDDSSDYKEWVIHVTRP